MFPVERSGSSFATTIPTLTPTSHPQATYKKDHLETIGGEEYHKVFYSAATLLYRKTSVPMAVG